MKEFFVKTFTKENLKKFFRTYIWLMVLLFVIDIVTKWVVLKHFGVDAMNSGIRKDNGAIVIIENFCYIGGAINDKAAFSLGISGNNALNRGILLTISVVMTGAFIFYYVKQYKKLTTVYKVALALMIAGGFGNLIDRAFYWYGTVGINGVIDWILFYFGSWDFPMFNIADSCLVIGIAILLVMLIVEEVKDAKKKSERGEFKYSPEELEAKKKEEDGNKGE